MAGVTEINRWLDTPAEVAHLQTDFLEPLASLWDAAARRRYDAWLATLVWE